MSKAFAGVGTVFNRSGTPLAEINSITGPGMTRDFIDVTSLDSTGGYREFIAGFRDGGTVVLNMNFTIDTWQLMKDDFEDDAAVGYSIELPDSDGTTISFNGLVTECPITIPTDDKVTADVTIKVTGEVSVDSGV